MLAAGMLQLPWPSRSTESTCAEQKVVPVPKGSIQPPDSQDAVASMQAASQKLAPKAR